MKVIEFTMAYGVSLCEARRFTEEEKARYSEWYRDYGLVRISDGVKLGKIGLEDRPKREPDGAFIGCENWAWILTEEEAEQYCTLNAQRIRAEQEEEARKEAERIAKKKAKALEYEKIRAQFDSWDVTPCGKYEVCHTMTIGGKTFRFMERDIFDVGIAVNPCYPVNGQKGGLGVSVDGAGYWQTMEPDADGNCMHRMTEQEEQCVRAIWRLGAFAGRRIRM